ncbi:MAG: SMC family ATPase [Anaerolineales bacterium]
MIPISLTLAGFLSYKDPVDIDFTSFDLACISGENGAGKSSILDGITWALFGRARKHDESVINLDSRGAEVTFVFYYEGNQYRVIRSNPRGETKLVEFYILQEKSKDPGDPVWKPLTERTLRETDQKIVDILRLDYEAFINASFLLQGEADQFTQQNPAARKKILTQILGMEIWEEFRQRASQKRRATESKINTLEGRIAEIRSELEEEEKRKDLLSSLEKYLAQAVEARINGEKLLSEMQAIFSSLGEQKKLVDAFAHQVDKITENIIKTQEKIVGREEEKKNFQEILLQANKIDEEYTDWERAQDVLSDWEKTAEKFREGEIKRQEPLLQITAEKARLLQEKNSLEMRYQELLSSLDELPGLSKKLTEQRKNIKKAEVELAKRDQKKTELELAQQQQAEAKAENPLLYQEMKDLEKRINDLEGTDGALCPLCGQELSPEDRKSLIQSLKADGKELGDRFRENKALLAEADQVVIDLQLQITEFSLVENNLRIHIQEMDKIDNQISRLNEDKKTWDSKHKKTLEGIQKKLENETYAEKARKQLSGINDELKKIGYDAAEHDRVRDIVNRGLSIQQKKGSLKAARAALKPIDREIKELAEKLAADQKDLKKGTSELERSRQALATAEEKAPDTQEAEESLLVLKERENILQREVGAAGQKVSVLEKQKIRKKDLELEHKKLSTLVKQYKQLEAAFGKDGVPALLIEQALPNIESKANQILDRLSGGAMSIRFLTQRSYKDVNREDLKETLDIQIRDLSGFRDYEMYSGGESFRIDFAVRLALSHVLAQRAGARLQTLVIDEGFGSQDSIGRQRLIEAINLIRDDFKKILVITHVEQIKEAFSTQLLVEKTPQGSQVTLV